MPERKNLQHIINSGFIKVVTDSGMEIPAFWAHPTVGGPFPGLILLHDDWGLEAATRAMAHRFAEEGYYVIAPDFFEGNRAHNQIEADSLEIRYKALALPKVIAALMALETHPKCNRKLAVVGWDIGAELAAQLALARQDIMAAVAISGDLTTYIQEDAEQLRCPLLVIWGAEDEIAHRTAEPLRTVLAQSSKQHQIIVYPQAAHAFYNYFTPMYKGAAAEDTWLKTLEFLELHQGKPPAPEEAVPGQFRPGRVY